MSEIEGVGVADTTADAPESHRDPLVDAVPPFRPDRDRFPLSPPRRVTVHTPAG